MGWLKTTAVTAMAPAIWGTTYIVTSQLLPPGHPLFASLVRALPAGLIASLIARSVPTGGWWWKSCVLGVLNMGVFFPLLFVAAYRLPGGVAATLGAGQPLIVAILAVALLGERLSWWRITWGVVGLAGVALVVLRSSARLDGIGVVAGLLSAASMALGVTLSKKWGRPNSVPALGIAGWQLTAGGLFLLPLTFILEGMPPTPDARAVAGYAWLCLVGGLISYALWFRGIGLLPVTSVAIMGLASPLVAAALGAAFLHQALTGLQLLGFALALTAMVASQIPPERLFRIRQSRSDQGEPA